jgi:hypothetical protein
MKKLILLVLIAPLLFTSCEVEKMDEGLIGVEARGKNQSVAAFDFEDAASCAATETDLIAGQHTVVGKVSVSVVGENYIVTYSVDPGYCLTETHLSVVDEPANFPMTPSGNPKNGNFEYSDTHGCVNSFSYEVPTSKGNFIAAHGVVTCVTEEAEEIDSSLPDSLPFCITSQGQENLTSYFEITIEGESFLAGDFPAWCVDADSFIQKACYDADVLSSYEDLSGTSFEKPENFDLVNWVLNQNWEAPYTFGDIQMALWLLLEDVGCPQCAGLGDASEERAQEIVDLAVANGEGYLPGCDEYVGIILLPVNPDETSDKEIQSLVIPYKLHCNDCEETVWADGCGFPGNNWAMYFYFPEAI